jgi:hypothetical protein
MRAIQKSVVIIRLTKDKSVRQIPLAVFAQPTDAIPYGRAIRDAHKAGDEITLTGLVMGGGVPAADYIGGTIKLSVVTLPYAPEYSVATDDPFADDEPPAK